MKKTSELILISVTTIFTLSLAPLAINNNSTIAQAATTKKVNHKKTKKHKVVKKIIKKTRKPKEFKNYLKIPSNYPIKLKNGKYVGKFPQNKRITSAFKINHFRTTKHDIKTHINYKHLSYKRQKSLSQYTANIINNVRHQITNNNPTTADLTVDKNTIHFVNEIVKGYNLDNWSLYKHQGHNVKRINKAAKKFGLNYSDDNNYKHDQQFYENAAGPLLHGKANLANVKYAIYYTLQKMFFDDAPSNWGHAYSLIGMDIPGQKSNTFAIGFDKLGQVHMETIPYYFVKKNLQRRQDIINDIDKEERQGIHPHISPDQSLDKQFTEFETILVENEEMQLAKAKKNPYIKITEINSYRKTVTIVDANYPNGKTFKFDPNLKLNK